MDFDIFTCGEIRNFKDLMRRILPLVSKVLESGVSWKDICEDFRKCLELPVNENGLKAAYYTAVQNFLDDHLLTIIKHYNGNPEDTRKYIRETFDLYLSEIQLANFLKTYVQSQFVARTFELEELKKKFSAVLAMP